MKALFMRFPPRNRYMSSSVAFIVDSSTLFLEGQLLPCSDLLLRPHIPSLLVPKFQLGRRSQNMCAETCMLEASRV